MAEPKEYNGDYRGWLRTDVNGFERSGLGGRRQDVADTASALADNWGIGSRVLSSAPLEIANVWIAELGGVMGGAAGH